MLMQTKIFRLNKKFCSGIKGEAPPLFMPQSTKFKIKFFNHDKLGRVYESSRSEYMNSKECGFIL